MTGFNNQNIFNIRINLWEYTLKKYSLSKKGQAVQRIFSFSRDTVLLHKGSSI